MAILSFLRGQLLATPHKLWQSRFYAPRWDLIPVGVHQTYGVLLKDKRFALGVALTLAWLLFMAYLLLSQTRPTELNAWGDFFAGFFAPVAFLWLVLGYLQQGEELRNSADALRLQAQELKNSVGQQGQLVEVSRQQMKQEMEAIQEEREQRREAARPKFVIRSAGSSAGMQGTFHNLQIFNVGNTATDLTVECDPPVGNFRAQAIDLIERNRQAQVLIGGPDSFATAVSISYRDADGVEGKVLFHLSAKGLGQLQVGEVSRVF